MNAKIVKIRYSGFAWFRFAVAAVLLLAAGMKTYQIATAPLPPVARGSLFTPLLDLLNNRHLLMAAVVGEILFAVVLVAGTWRQWSWLLSVLLFSAFALVSLMKGLNGESSCGCFGVITISPWVMTVFDLFILILLGVFRERLSWNFNLSPSDRKKLIVALVAWLVLAGPALFAMLSLKQQAHATLGTEFTGPDGKPI